MFGIAWKSYLHILKLQRNGALPRATGPPLSALKYEEQHKLRKQLFPNLSSRQLKTKLRPGSTIYTSGGSI